MGLLSSIVNATNHAKCLLLNNQKWEIQPTLLIYILINTDKNFTIIHFQLN